MNISRLSLFLWFFFFSKLNNVSYDQISVDWYRTTTIGGATSVSAFVTGYYSSGAVIRVTALQLNVGR